MASSVSLQRIVHTPGVVGGRASVQGTRIPVWIIVDWSRFGWSVETIGANYPGLTRDDIEAALEYARVNPDEIERDLAEQDDDSD